MRADTHRPLMLYILTTIAQGEVVRLSVQSTGYPDYLYRDEPITITCTASRYTNASGVFLVNGAGVTDPRIGCGFGVFNGWVKSGALSEDLKMVSLDNAFCKAASSVAPPFNMSLEGLVTDSLIGPELQCLAKLDEENFWSSEKLSINEIRVAPSALQLKILGEESNIVEGKEFVFRCSSFDASPESIFVYEVLRNGVVIANATDAYTPNKEDRDGFTLRCTDTVHYEALEDMYPEKVVKEMNLSIYESSSTTSTTSSTSNTSNTSTTSSDENADKMKKMGGIVAGVILAIVAVTVGVFITKRRDRRTHRTGATNIDGEQAPPAPRRPSPEELDPGDVEHDYAQVDPNRVADNIPTDSNVAFTEEVSSRGSTEGGNDNAALGYTPEPASFSLRDRNRRTNHSGDNQTDRSQRIPTVPSRIFPEIPQPSPRHVAQVSVPTDSNVAITEEVSPRDSTECDNDNLAFAYTLEPVGSSLGDRNHRPSNLNLNPDDIPVNPDELDYPYSYACSPTHLPSWFTGEYDDNAAEDATIDEARYMGGSNSGASNNEADHTAIHTSANGNTASTSDGYVDFKGGTHSPRERTQKK